jgi:hypothetical protein
MFLRCVVCGRRSQGWVVNDRDHAHAPHGTLRNTLESTTAAAQ